MRMKKKTRVGDAALALTLTLVFVPRAGIEPALLAKLDFESSASTNSATWAFRNWSANLVIFFLTQEFYEKISVFGISLDYLSLICGELI
jgi:hypothetical protein